MIFVLRHLVSGILWRGMQKVGEVGDIGQPHDVAVHHSKKKRISDEERVRRW
jgi:hypothetical protein